MVADDEMSREELLRTIQRMVKQHGERWTGQRDLICQIFIDAGEHLTSDELYQLVHDQDPSVSMTTVYRTMNLLCDLGIAAKRHFEGKSAAFELLLGKGHHHHLIDTDSGRVIEFVDDELEQVMQRVAEQLGYKIACHRIEIFGKPLG
ncbi:MAG: Fur family transcriptional regulator [Planctomycetota bacterium]